MPLQKKLRRRFNLSLNGKNILVIDDTHSIRTFVRLILEEANYNIVEAENGAIGIEKFKSNIFDLVITDIYMPVSSGLEVVVQLEKEYPNTKIIVLSDGGKENFSNDLNVCEALGASCFLSKSKIKDELLTLVNDILK